VSLFEGIQPGVVEARIALCFDLYNDAEGLPETLEALSRRGLKATFFLGGDFIRRYPGAASDIKETGNEAASLFFASIDLTDARYNIDADFITRGLARNEDEFYRATGKELDLLWHAPYFATPIPVQQAASAAGYRTVMMDIDPLDWLPDMKAADLVDRIADLAFPDAVVPVRLGLLPGGRQDYLFNRIDVLLDALARKGYKVVPVSQIR
jgi:peptidoglycan/xylan/chitin deacetylase (PgdA/CDA1 family)